MTEAQILTLITDYITTNSNGEITAVKVKEIMDELASSNLNLEKLKLNLTDNSDSFVVSQKGINTALALKSDKTPILQTVASTASLTPLTSNDLIEVTALTEAITINEPSGAVGNGKTLLFRIKDDGTARALTFNAIFVPIGSALPTTTEIGKNLYFITIKDTTSGNWHVFPYYNEL